MTDNKYIGVKGLEELIALTKNSLAKKANTLQFDVMPDPVMYIGKVVQYVGITDTSFTRSHFYYSDGTRWNEENMSDEQTSQIKIINALPAWTNADSNILYVLKGATDNTMSLYVKNASVNGAWFTVESGGSFAIVDSLPQWSEANDSTIYFKTNGDTLTGYIKNTGTINAWYTLGGTAQEIDTALSPMSINPVQNKIVYAAIQDVLAKVANTYRYKGSCLAADLPTEGNAVGDTWNLEDGSSYGPAGVNVAWTGTEWDALSGDMNYMRGLHDPDWSGIIKYTEDQLSGVYTFTCPSRGFINMGANLSTRVTLNDTTLIDVIAYKSFPVNKGDKITWTRSGSDLGECEYIFVPYKVQ